jgi:hypothetical protein
MSIRAAVNIGTLTSRLLVSGLFLGLIILEPSTAASQQSNAANQAPNTGQDFFKPPANLFQLLYGYRTAPGSGDATVTTDTLNLRLDHRIDLSQQSFIALRTDLPLLAKNPITSGNPDGDYLYGIGDFDAQALYIYDFDKRWAAGFGARVIAPTGWDVLSSGKWQIMPIAGFRYGLSEFSSGSFLEPFARYDVSFAGDPSKRNISNLQLAPFQPWASRPLVHRLLSKRRYSREFWRSCRGANRASFHSPRCASGTQSDGSCRPFA